MDEKVQGGQDDQLRTGRTIHMRMQGVMGMSC